MSASLSFYDIINLISGPALPWKLRFGLSARMKWLAPSSHRFSLIKGRRVGGFSSATPRTTRCWAEKNWLCSKKPNSCWILWLLDPGGTLTFCTLCPTPIWAAIKSTSSPWKSERKAAVALPARKRINCTNYKVLNNITHFPYLILEVWLFLHQIWPFWLKFRSSFWHSLWPFVLEIGNFYIWLSYFCLKFGLICLKLAHFSCNLTAFARVSFLN